jgi:trk system potassium uptake protein TrkH
MFQSRFISSHPMLYPVMGFLVLIIIGTVLLLLPFSSHNGLSFLDALFTATSAACVNGLSVVSVGQDLTRAGQAILMGLMEVGGIGIMALSTTIMLLIHSKMNFGQQSVLALSYSSENQSSGYIIKQIIKVTAVIELGGTVILFTQWGNLPLDERIFNSVFHAVSAFCNAGFSLMDNSMIDFYNNWAVNLALMFLIICGGFGFLPISELISKRRDGVRVRTLTLHTRLVCIMVPLLIVIGTLAFLGMEWNDSLKNLQIPDKILVSLFQSVTTRSAGLCTTDFSVLGASTLFFMIILMFIGASPGGCGGGIKTTTAAIIGLLGFNRFWGRKKTQVFNRSIPEVTVDRAIRIFLLSIIVIVLGCISLLIFETENLHGKESQALFLNLLFETVSAFSTCGLSMGITPDLGSVSKVIVSVIMFVGRLGPLVLVQAVISPPKSGVYYSEENVMVG